MQLSKKINAVFDRVLDGFAGVACVLIVLLMLSVSAETVSRYFLNLPIPGLDEISEVVIFYITFLGTAWLLREEGHIAIDSVLVRLKPRIQRWLNVISSVLGVSMCLVLVWYSTSTTLYLWEKGAVSPTVLRIPVAVCIAIIPVGGSLLVFQFLRRAYLMWHRR